MTAYQRQKEKTSNGLAVDSSLTSEAKVFTKFLLLTQICSGTQDQSKIFIKKNSCSLVIILLLVHEPDGILKPKPRQ